MNESATPDRPLSIDSRQVRDLLECDEAIKDYEEKVKDLKATRRAIEEDLLEDFGACGVQRINQDGKTVYVRETLRASLLAETRSQANEVLNELGLSDMITNTVSASTLAARVREWLDPDTGEGIPPQLEPFLSVYNQRQISVRKA